MAGKFDLQKIIDDVKTMVTPASIPEANKDDPVGYHLSELNKLIKELAEAHTKQADIIAKINPILGSLYQELKGSGQAPAATEAKSSQGEKSCDSAPAASSDEVEKGS